MAHTAHADPEMMKERQDKPKVLEKKLDQLAEMVRNSKHCVVFTGAGISTDAGIPDFRGPDGVWTLKAKGKKRTKRTVDTLCAIPTPTHMALVELQKRGMVKYLISQNCDGLHRRSGIEPSKISELHGNGNIEFCEDCGYEYLRDYHCYRIKRGSDHYTGRHCVVPVIKKGKGEKKEKKKKKKKNKKRTCNGRLMNSTIDFGQNLPVRPLELAYHNSDKADLHIVLGSSLTVSPACDMPKISSKKGGDLVICNLQNTPLDKYATTHIYARCNKVMEGLMQRLDIPIPEFRLHRIVKIGINHSNTDEEKPTKFHIKIQGLERGTKGQMIPASVISRAEMLLPKKYGDKRGVVLAEEPLTYSASFASHKEETTPATIRLHFMGHYNEPPLDTMVELQDARNEYMILSYDPMRGIWSITRHIKLAEGAGDDLFAEILNNSKGHNAHSYRHLVEEIVSSKKETILIEKEEEEEEKEEKELIVEDKKGKEKYIHESIPEEDEETYINLFGRPVVSVDTFIMNEMIDKENSSPGPTLWGELVMSKDKRKLIPIGGSVSSSSGSKKKVTTPLQYEFDMSTHKWSSSTPHDSAKKLPFVGGARWGHSSAVWPDTPHLVYLFGGWDNGAQYNDVHTYDTTSHIVHNVKVEGTRTPSCRAGHSTTPVNNDLAVLFGGAECSGGKYKYFNDIYVFSKSTRIWKKIDMQIKGVPPCPRAQHAAVMVDTRTLAIIGGYDGNTVLHDVHLLDLIDMKWRDLAIPTGDAPSTIPITHSPPPYRVYPAKPSALVLIPQITSEGRGIHSSAHNPHLAYMCAHGLYALDLIDWEWKKLNVNEEIITTCHSAVKVDENTMALFGGLNAHSNEPTSQLILIKLQIIICKEK